ncbi:hypothetical protein BJV78DRAFT_1285941 [Lactifluus subvellereus]|nr:hypothetical protein BJV78DRAFT_1285941 [Lactifluus subvellereus]
MSPNSVPLSGEILLRHIATSLHVLTLAYCDIDPSSLLLRAPLVSLRLEKCQVESPLEILSLLPQLRTLVLEHTHGTRLRGSSDVVHLLQLQQLELTNISSVVVFILQGIRPPASVSLSIVCTDYIDADEPLDDVTLLRTIVFTISPVLSAYLERALEEGYALPLLEIATPTDTSKKTVALLDRTSPSPTTESCQLHFSVVWGDASGSTDLFSQMLSALPAATLQHVHILRMRDNPLRAADARSRLRSLAQFHDKARDEAVQGLLAIVTQQELLPTLRQISFEGVEVEHLDVDLLARVLVLRRRMFSGEGVKIRLSLRDCLVGQGTIAVLRDSLGSDAVDWE